eukprot:459364-Rhodomonas_salina.2
MATREHALNSDADRHHQDSLGAVALLTARDRDSEPRSRSDSGVGGPGGGEGGGGAEEGADPRAT